MAKRGLKPLTTKIQKCDPFNTWVTQGPREMAASSETDMWQWPWATEERLTQAFHVNKNTPIYHSKISSQFEVGQTMWILSSTKN